MKMHDGMSKKLEMKREVIEQLNAKLRSQRPDAVRSRAEILDMGLKQFHLGYDIIQAVFFRPELRTTGKSKQAHYFVLPDLATEAKKQQEPIAAVLRLAVPAVSSANSQVSDNAVFIPATDPSFLKWGEYDTIHKIISSRNFFPVYISGASGNGKTMMVEQACANLKREYIRVQVSPETDEDDLIGGFRLLDGQTVFAKGPVVHAMEQGCILLIDEIDRGSMKIVCLLGVLEGKPIRIKKTGEIITPKPGFNVIATANTRGKGSQDGKYAAASIMDDALLERFSAAIEQTYAPEAIEKKILIKHMEKYNAVDEDFATKLVSWSSVIRKTFENGAVEDIISTRRLCHIAHSFSMFNNRTAAITMAVTKFDENTKNAFLDLYTKIDQMIGENTVLENNKI